MPKLALISLDQKWEDKQHNLLRCESLVNQACMHKADLIIFPEMTLTGFTMNTAYSAENAFRSESIDAFKKLAYKNAVSIIFGLVLESKDKPLNTLVALSNDGVEQARYAKIHPFSFSGESEHFDSGNHLAAMQMGNLNIGLSICYDLRFPELYSALAKKCNVLVNIASWPRKRVSHWLALLKARAIENQVYTVGVNRVGVDGNGLEYVSSSVIYDPNGDVLDPIHVDNELSIYEVSVECVAQYRASFSTTHDRRVDLYKEVLV